jgi:hypothetical protein
MCPDFPECCEWVNDATAGAGLRAFGQVDAAARASGAPQSTVRIGVAGKAGIDASFAGSPGSCVGPGSLCAAASCGITVERTYLINAI